MAFLDQKFGGEKKCLNPFPAILRTTKNPTAIKLGVGVRPFNGTAIKKRMASLIY